MSKQVPPKKQFMRMGKSQSFWSSQDNDLCGFCGWNKFNMHTLDGVTYITCTRCGHAVDSTIRYRVIFTENPTPDAVLNASADESHAYYERLDVICYPDFWDWASTVFSVMTKKPVDVFGKVDVQSIQDASGSFAEALCTINEYERVEINSYNVKGEKAKSIVDLCQHEPSDELLERLMHVMFDGVPKKTTMIYRLKK